MKKKRGSTGLCVSDTPAKKQSKLNAEEEEEGIVTSDLAF
jgi:hypothetical protein